MVKKARKFSFIIVLMLIGVLLTGYVGQVDKRKSAEEDINALIKSYAETFQSEPEGFSILFNYPLEVHIKRGDDPTPKREQVESAEEFAKLLDWKKNENSQFENVGMPEIYLDNNYKNAFVKADFHLKHTNGSTSRAFNYIFELKNKNNQWLILDYRYVITLNE